MKFVPEQDFIQHVSTPKYEFSMLDWFGGVLHPTFINFSLISNVSTFELQFQFLNVFSNFEFRFNHKYFLWMRKAQNHVLQAATKGKSSIAIWKKRILQKRLKKRSKRRGTLQKRPNQKKRRIGRMRKYLCWLIDMLEEKPCLSDVFYKHYKKRDIKEIAYTGIASSLDINIESIKAKIDGLRAQLGGEVAKVNKPKNGQVLMSSVPPVGSTTIACLFSCL